jgi:hypothetical protein
LFGLKNTLLAGLMLAGHEGVPQPTAAMLRMRAVATFKKQLCCV